MSIINGLSNSNTSYTNLSASNETNAQQTVATASATATAATTTQGLDSYISSQAVSLADYLSKDSDSSSSSLYSVLTYGQQGKLDLICNKVTGADGEVTNQNVTLADYLANGTTSNDLASVLTSGQDKTKK